MGCYSYYPRKLLVNTCWRQPACLNDVLNDVAGSNDARMTVKNIVNAINKLLGNAPKKLASFALTSILKWLFTRKRGGVRKVHVRRAWCPEQQRHLSAIFGVIYREKKSKTRRFVDCVEESQPSSTTQQIWVAIVIAVFHSASWFSVLQQLGVTHSFTTWQRHTPKKMFTSMTLAWRMLQTKAIQMKCTFPLKAVALWG